MEKRKIHLVTGSLLICALLLSCSSGIVGNGEVISQNKKTGDFTSLEIHGNFDVFLNQSEEAGVRIEADENIMDIIKVVESDNKLKIISELNILRARKKNLYINYKDLKNLELTGAVHLRSDGKNIFKSLDIVGGGAMDVKLEIEAERLGIEMSGAADFDLSGKVKEADLSISGAGGFDMIEMRSEKMAIEISGAAHARVFVSEELRVDISGAGAVRYKGNPEIKRNVSGVGSLKRY